MQMMRCCKRAGGLYPSLTDCLPPALGGAAERGEGQGICARALNPKHRVFRHSRREVLLSEEEAKTRAREHNAAAAREAEARRKRAADKKARLADAKARSAAEAKARAAEPPKAVRTWRARCGCHCGAENLLPERQRPRRAAPSRQGSAVRQLRLGACLAHMGDSDEFWGATRVRGAVHGTPWGAYSHCGA